MWNLSNEFISFNMDFLVPGSAILSLFRLHKVHFVITIDVIFHRLNNALFNLILLLLSSKFHKRFADCVYYF